jgi:putative YhbY family RNA-binding protein
LYRSPWNRRHARPSRRRSPAANLCCGTFGYTRRMITLTPSQRRELRARAHPLHPVVAIGHAGLSPTVLHEIDVALGAHELVKVRVHSDDRDEREAHLAGICESLDAAPVQHLGKILILWRPAPKPEPEPRRREKPAKSPGRRRESLGAPSGGAGRQRPPQVVGAPTSKHRRGAARHAPRESAFRDDAPRPRRGPLADSPPPAGAPRRRLAGAKLPVASGERKSATGKRQASGSKRPPREAKRPPSGAGYAQREGKRPSSAASRPPREPKLPSSGAKRPPREPKLPSSGAKRPPREAKLPSSGAKRPPREAKLPSSGAKRPPAGAKRPPSAAKRPPSGARRPPATADRGPAGGAPTAVRRRRRPTGGR